MQLILVDRSSDLCRAWTRVFAGTDVQIVHGDFTSVPEYDCVVSPANSFGLMDGGFDQALTEYFGPRLQQEVQRRIRDQYLGEQPVGTCLMVATPSDHHPWIAHAPTMRVPMSVATTENAYLAMRAVLVAAHHHNYQRTNYRIETLLCPGLATATGRMPVLEAARQMRAAYDSVQDVPSELNWQVADEFQNRASGLRPPTIGHINGADLINHGDNDPHKTLAQSKRR